MTTTVKMSATDRSIAYFGVYAMLTGVALLLVPNLVLAPVGMAPAQEVWIRVLGVVAWALGYYYWCCGRAGVRAFAQATVVGRVVVFLAFGGLVASGLAKPALMVFGAIDLAGAAWTWSAMRAEPKA